MLVLAGAVLAGVAAACSAAGVNKTGQQRIHLIAAADANRSVPVMVDVVYVFNPVLRDMLSNFSAAAWFSARSDLLVRNDDLIKVISERVSPGEYRLVPEFPPDSREALAGFIFANYITAGAHRSSFTPPASLKVTFREKTFEVSNR